MNTVVGPAPEQQAVLTSGLVFARDSRVILDGVNLSITRGEIVGIIGSSGSGKSTLIKCMAGLLAPAAGTVRLCGKEIAGLGEKSLLNARANVGFVFQYSALFDSMTVFENIALAPMRRLGYTRKTAAALVRDTLALVHLSGTEGLYPSQLSGGMAKRVGLARALATSPQVLFYDEPTSGLDPPTARSIDELIAETRRRLGLTSVVVSHDVGALARIADRIALLHDGAVAVYAPPGEFLASEHPVIQRFVQAGAGGAVGPS